MQEENLVEPFEMMFIQDVFQITFQPNKQSNQQIYLEQTHKTLQQQNKRLISFAQSNDTLLDSALFERISMNGINPLQYLYSCKRRRENVKDDQLYSTPQVQQLIHNSQELIFNYLRFAILTPDDLFPNRDVPQAELQVNNAAGKVAVRLLDLFQNEGLDPDFFDQIHELITEEFKNDVYIEILRITLQEYKKLSIFDTLKSNFYLSIIKYYLQRDYLKYLFITQNNVPWITGPQGVALEKGIGSAQGQFLELSSVLGPLLRQSLFPRLVERPQDSQINEEVGRKVQEAINKKQTRKAFEMNQNQFWIAQQDYVNQLSEIFKLLLRKGEKLDYFQETFRWFTAVLVGNVNRIKEGVHLEKQNKKIMNYSSDALMMNVYDIMLDLSRKIFDRKDEQTYKKIDPMFWLSDKFEFIQNQPLLYEIKTKPPIPDKKDYGNVTNLFFYTMQYAHFSFQQTIKNYKQLLNEVDELKKSIDMLRNANMHQHRLIEMKNHLEKLDLQASQYEIGLLDNKRIRDTADLYDTFIILLIEWCQIDLTAIKDGVSSSFKPFWLLNYIPESYIDNIYEFHVFFASHKENYFQTHMTNQRIINLLTLTTLLSCQIPFASNKYLQAKFIELVYFFLKLDSKQNTVKAILNSYSFAQENLLIGLIRFYVDIETTGANHQFYSKFSYRYYTNELLMDLLKIPFYEKQLSRYLNEQYFERMIKMLMNDLNYSIDEGWQKLQKVNEKDKKQQQVINPQQQLQEQHERDFMIKQIKSNLSHATSTVKVVALFSKIVPSALCSEMFRDLIASMFNHFLELLLDRQYSPIIKLIALLGKIEFKLDQFLYQISLIYTYLMDNKEFVRSIVKDQRSFKLELFSSLTNRMSLQGNSQLQMVEKLITLTEQLQITGDTEFEIEDLIDEDQIPQKYVDPIMGTVMKDPVKLPTSQNIMDRANIKNSLLDKEQDPFTRQPLKVSDLIEMPELKREIEEWKKLILRENPKKAEIFRQKAIAAMKKNSQKIEEEQHEEEDPLFQGRKQQFNDDE